MYSNWYHHLSLDRQDRLFLDYRYYANQLSAQEIRAYRQKWPQDNLPQDTRPGSFPKSVRPHDPAMLFSNDAGTTIDRRSANGLCCNGVAMGLASTGPIHCVRPIRRHSGSTVLNRSTPTGDASTDQRAQRESPRPECSISTR